MQPKIRFLIIFVLGISALLLPSSSNAATRRFNISELQTWSSDASVIEFVQTDKKNIFFFDSEGAISYFTAPITTTITVTYNGSGGTHFDDKWEKGEIRSSWALRFSTERADRPTYFVAPTEEQVRSWCRRGSCDGTFETLTSRVIGNRHCPNCLPEMIRYITNDCTESFAVKDGYKMFVHKKDGRYGRYSSAKEVCIAYFWKQSHNQDIIYR